MNKTDQKIEKLTKELGNISNNNGAVAGGNMTDEAIEKGEVKAY